MSDMKTDPIVIKLKRQHVVLMCVAGFLAVLLCGYFFLLRPYLRFAAVFRSPPYVMLEIYEYDDAGNKVNTIKKKIEDKKDIEALWKSMDILPFKRWSFSAVPKPDENQIKGVLEYPEFIVADGVDWPCPIVIYGNGKTHWGPTPDDKGFWRVPALAATFDRLAVKARNEIHNKEGLDGRQSPPTQP